MEKYWVVTDERDERISFLAYSMTSRIIPSEDTKDDVLCYIETKDGKREKVYRKNKYGLQFLINEDEVLILLQNDFSQKDMNQVSLLDMFDDIFTEEDGEDIAQKEVDTDPLTETDIRNEKTQDFLSPYISDMSDVEDFLRQ